MSALRLLRRYVGCILLVAPALAGGQGPDSGPDELLVHDLLDYLGFSDQHLEALLAGEAVFHGMDRLERLEEDVAAAGVMMLVERRSTPEVIESFLDTEVFKRIHDLVRHDGVDSGDAFDDFEFRDADVARRIVADPAGSLNLSAEEAERFSRIDRNAPNAADLASVRFRDVLASRYADYARTGLEGVAAYERGNGRSVSPALEIRSGLEGMKSLHDDFEPFFDRIGAPLDETTRSVEDRRMHWVEKIVNDTSVVALLDQHVARLADSGLAVELHYYSSAAYNAMLTLVAAAPYGDQTLVFAINHTYTDQVTGLGASLRRRLARKLAADALSRHLLEVRTRVHAMP